MNNQTNNVEVIEDGVVLSNNEPIGNVFFCGHDVFAFMEGQDLEKLDPFKAKCLFSVGYKPLMKQVETQVELGLLG